MMKLELFKITSYGKCDTIIATLWPTCLDEVLRDGKVVGFHFSFFSVLMVDARFRLVDCTTII